VKKNLILVIFYFFTIQSSFSQGITDYKSGGANSPVSGSATNSGNQNAAPSLEKCEKNFGTIAVAQPQDHVSQALSKYGLPAPNNLLRLMIQQSGCFRVVERGVAMENIMQERRLQETGQLRSDSNMSKGQLKTADYILTAEVVFSEDNSAGAAIGAIGSLFGIPGVGAIAGLKFKQASTTLMLADTRSGEQIAAAEGSVEKADWGAGGFLGGVGGGAYTNTNEGKIVAAALLDNYNNIVKAIKLDASIKPIRKN
jgi:curli biogenesis system outer membrane secretion channel CsgG